HSRFLLPHARRRLRPEVDTFPLVAAAAPIERVAPLLRSRARPNASDFVRRVLRVRLQRLHELHDVSPAKASAPASRYLPARLAATRKARVPNESLPRTDRF